MSAVFFRSAILGVILSATFTLSTASTLPVQFRGLEQRSPFGTVAMDPSSTALMPDPLEFRAILEEKGRHYFSLFETASKRSIWVGLNDSTSEISVKRYSSTENTILVDYHGSFLTLALKGAPKRFPPEATTAPQLSTGPVSETTNEYDDQPFRIGHVAEEIEIRESVRQKTSPGPNSGSDGGLKRH